MFGAACDSVSTTWADESDSRADYIEAYQYEGAKSDALANFRTGHLVGAQIATWLKRTTPEHSSSGARLLGGFRLLICERLQYSPLDFPITKTDFDTAKTVFNLPASTLAIFDSDAGSFSRYLQYGDPARQILKRVGVVLKAPQKREIANYALSCSYDVSTGITTGLLYGTNVPSFDDKLPALTLNVVLAEQQDRMRGSRESACRSQSRDVASAQWIVSAEDRSDNGTKSPLVRSLKESQSAWSHPLLLPAIVLTEHMRRAKQFCNVGEVMQETWAIEGELGVTYVGRWIDRTDDRLSLDDALEGKKTLPFTSSRREHRRTKSWQAALNAQSKLSKGGIIGRAKAEELTVRINTQSLRILFTARSPQWNSQCSQAIRSLMDELAVPLASKLDTQAHDDLKELLEYNISTAESVGSHVASMKERMALQLDVLYSMVAQMDNRLSARLAASAGRDSTSMKILAFITAFYLPAQAVGTLFGMSMFAWPHKQDNSNNGSDGSQESIVSDWFWLYWAVTIPLTLVTLGGWGIWWVMEMSRFKKSYAEALGEAGESADEFTADRDVARRARATAPSTAQIIRRRQISRSKSSDRRIRRQSDVEQAATVGAEKSKGR